MGSGGYITQINSQLIESQRLQQAPVRAPGALASPTSMHVGAGSGLGAWWRPVCSGPHPQGQQSVPSIKQEELGCFLGTRSRKPLREDVQDSFPDCSRGRGSCLMSPSSLWAYRGVNRDAPAGTGKWLCWAPASLFTKGPGMVRGQTPTICRWGSSRDPKRAQSGGWHQSRVSAGARSCFWTKGGCGWGGDVGLYLRFHLMRALCNRVSLYFLILSHPRKDWGGHAGSICASASPARHSLCCFCPLSGTRAICCTFLRVAGQGGLAGRACRLSALPWFPAPCGQCPGHVAAQALPPALLGESVCGPACDLGGFWKGRHQQQCQDCVAGSGD